VNTLDASAVVHAYHEAWTSKDFDTAENMLADDLVVEVPINDYPTAKSFAAAVAGTASITTNVDLLAAMSAGDEAMLLYDMSIERLGTLRVAEHFTVNNGKIIRIRQVHDTAPVRAAGLGG
jgi:hypothetical protein